jgi:hypothetical protein
MKKETPDQSEKRGYFREPLTIIGNELGFLGRIQPEELPSYLKINLILLGEEESLVFPWGK